MHSRHKAKEKYASIIKVSQFNQLASFPFFKQLCVDNPVHIQREALMGKCNYVYFLLFIDANGDMLSAEEYKFLANTSELLNSCVDKKET